MATWLAINISANSNSMKGDRLHMPKFYTSELENAVKDLKEGNSTEMMASIGLLAANGQSFIAILQQREEGTHQET